MHVCTYVRFVCTYVCRYVGYLHTYMRTYIHTYSRYVCKEWMNKTSRAFYSIAAELEIAVGHWPFSDQFQELADQN